jgi:AraC-like DNA-binding protein
MNDIQKPIFWRDARMPHVELRKVTDGRSVCYEPHTHTQWSAGAITGGESTFVCGDRKYRVQQGALVFINPDCVHACNPIEQRPWAYLMLYLDTDWLARLRHETGFLEAAEWQDFPRDLLRDSALFDGFTQLADCLLDADTALLDKQTRLIQFISDLLPGLSAPATKSPARHSPAPDKLRLIADYLDAHCTEDVSLDTLGALAGYTPGHLIRAFKQHFKLTPHAYMVNRRIQFGQLELKRGKSISEAAMNAGFSDQPHFQRVFKRLVAATPRQYRTSNNQV